MFDSRALRGMATLTLALAICGCRARLTSTAMINGEAFRPTACRSGETFGTTGVELTDESPGGGKRLRLVATPAGQAMAYYFGPGTGQYVPVGLCGPLTVNRQNSRINSIYNVEGSATLSCSNGAVTLSGAIEFSNCH